MKNTNIKWQSNLDLFENPDWACLFYTNLPNPGMFEKRDWTTIYFPGWTLTSKGIKKKVFLSQRRKSFFQENSKYKERMLPSKKGGFRNGFIATKNTYQGKFLVTKFALEGKMLTEEIAVFIWINIIKKHLCTSYL